MLQSLPALAVKASATTWSESRVRTSASTVAASAAASFAASPAAELP